MRLFTLDERLSLCASLVRHNSKIADIGTDHACLPVYLVYSGICPCAVATDINEGPLMSGRECVHRYSLEDRIDLRLCSGLEKVKREDADDIIIAGMGGELIRDILSSCDFIKDSSLRLILQPMTKYEVLIRYLYDNGFILLQQKTCRVKDKVYTVLQAQYTGDKIQYDEYDTYRGILDLSDPVSREFISRAVTHLEKKGLSSPDLKTVAEKLKSELKEGSDNEQS